MNFAESWVLWAIQQRFLNFRSYKELGVMDRLLEAQFKVRSILPVWLPN